VKFVSVTRRAQTTATVLTVGRRRLVFVENIECKKMCVCGTTKPSCYSALRQLNSGSQLDV
jgi:hypothetical protein